MIQRLWKESDTYWLDTTPQKDPTSNEVSERWLKLRSGRLTASNAGTAAGHSMFSTPEQLADQLAGITPKVFSEESKRVMNLGNEREPIARDWYCQTNNVTVEELGLAVPKWNLYLGGSVDGAVVGNDKIIEIKCPEKMYGPLVNHMEKLKYGWKAPQFYHEHIWDSHYDQMQLCMKILGKKYCDYIVYCVDENSCFTETVAFNEKYWNEDLYPKLTHFIENLLKPRLEKQNIKLEIPE